MVDTTSASLLLARCSAPTTASLAGVQPSKHQSEVVSVSNVPLHGAYSYECSRVQDFPRLRTSARHTARARRCLMLASRRALSCREQGAVRAHAGLPSQPRWNFLPSWQVATGRFRRPTQPRMGYCRVLSTLRRAAMRPLRLRVLQLGALCLQDRQALRIGPQHARSASAAHADHAQHLPNHNQACPHYPRHAQVSSPSRAARSASNGV